MAKLRDVLSRFAGALVPKFTKRPYRNDPPPTRIYSRTGDDRYIPRPATFKPGKDGRPVAQMANRLDEISLVDYERVRWYPAVLDGIRAIVSPAARANVHFVCDRQEIADLAQQELAPLLASFLKQSLKGGMEFGYHAVEMRWIPKFDVLCSGGIGDGGTEASETFYPFIWTVSRFAHFDPKDSRILVFPRTGDFAGIRQFVVTDKQTQDVPAAKCLIYTFGREYDQHHGIPITKSAIPYVDIALSYLESSAQYGAIFAVPGMIGTYPTGQTTMPDGQVVENGTLMQEMVSAIGAGERMSIPSSQYEGGGQKWDIKFFAPPGTTQPFTDLLRYVDDQIRLCIGVNEMATAQGTDSGGLGDQGADDKIGLHLQNIETYLDDLKPQLEKLAKAFKDYNFGNEAPPLKVYFEPVDMNVTKALLAAVVQILSTGQPIQDADGNLIYPDWKKILQDKGIPVVNVSGKRLANQLLEAAKLQGSPAADKSGGEGGSAGESLINSLMPKPDTSLEEKKSAHSLLLSVISKIDTAPAIRRNLMKLAIQLDEEFEGKHPRNEDGSFKTKEQIEAEQHVADDEMAAAHSDNAAIKYRDLPTEAVKERLQGHLGAIRENGAHGLGSDAYAHHTGHAHAFQQILDRRSKDGAGPTSMDKKVFKAVAKRVQDSGFTRGRLPNIAEVNGDLFVPRVEGNQVILRPALPDEVMPSIRAKMEERNHPAYQAMLDRTAKRANPTPEPAPAPATAATPAPETSQTAFVGTSAEGFPFHESRMDPKDIGVYPGMQYKKSEVTDTENQVGETLKGVEKYDQATAGPLTVWKRNDGTVHVMNGHHRRELAIRTGEQSVPVRIFHESDGVDFQTARALGALQNVRDGKGTALDAAFVIKDLGFTLDELKGAGVNLKSGVGRDAVSLMKLDAEALDMIKNGLTTQQCAAGIADAGLTPEKQRLAINQAHRGELETRQQGEIIGRKIAGAKTIERDSGNLFDDVQMDVPWAESAAIESAVVSALSRDARLYSKMTKGAAVGSTIVDHEAQQTMAGRELLAKRSVATSPAIQSAIEDLAIEYAKEPTKSKLNQAVETVLNVARAEGDRRQSNNGVA